MVINDQLKLIRDIYQKRSTEVPNFIDTRSDLDYFAYVHYREILACIIALIKGDKYPKNHIKLLIDRSNESMDEIFRVYDNKKSELKFIMMSSDILTFITDLMNDLLDNELYEAAANLKDFSENFYRSGE